MFFKKKSHKSNARKNSPPKGVRFRKFSGMEPRKFGESPWEPGTIPGGKIPSDKKPPARAND